MAALESDWRYQLELKLKKLQEKEWNNRNTVSMVSKYFNSKKNRRLVQKPDTLDAAESPYDIGL
jgi:hypothetical protein